jgi:hypothetical protein
LQFALCEILAIFIRGSKTEPPKGGRHDRRT